jgi:hypothetical protein
MWLERVASFTGGSIVVLSLSSGNREKPPDETVETVLVSDRFS